MEKEKILQADMLDILFEGRNKEYGAYDLRKTYNRRLVKALMVTGSVVALVLVSYFISAMGVHKVAELKPIGEVDLTEVKTEKKPDPIIVPPKVEMPKQEIKQFTPPQVVPDDKVKPDEAPPAQDDLETAKIGNVNQAGTVDDGIVAPPPSDGGKGITEAPKQQEPEDVIFTKVEVESTYPGGMAAWARYLNKSLRVPDEAINNGIQGSVMVQFIVDQEGNVSDVQAVSGPTEGGLREEAIRVIRKSGKWTPAIQNGRKVKSYKKQPIGFIVNEQ